MSDETKGKNPLLKRIVGQAGAVGTAAALLLRGEPARAQQSTAPGAPIDPNAGFVMDGTNYIPGDYSTKMIAADGSVVDIFKPARTTGLGENPNISGPHEVVAVAHGHVMKGSWAEGTQDGVPVRTFIAKDKVVGDNFSITLPDQDPVVPSSYTPPSPASGQYTAAQNPPQGQPPYPDAQPAQNGLYPQNAVYEQVNGGYVPILVDIAYIPPVVYGCNPYGGYYPINQGCFGIVDGFICCGNEFGGFNVSFGDYCNGSSRGNWQRQHPNWEHEYHTGGYSRNNNGNHQGGQQGGYHQPGNSNHQSDPIRREPASNPIHPVNPHTAGNNQHNPGNSVNWQQRTHQPDNSHLLLKQIITESHNPPPPAKNPVSYVPRDPGHVDRVSGAPGGQTASHSQPAGNSGGQHGGSAASGGKRTR